MWRCLSRWGSCWWLCERSKDTYFEVDKRNLLKSNGGQGRAVANAAKARHLKAMAYVATRDLLELEVIKRVTVPVHVTVEVSLPKAASRFDPPNYYPSVKPLIDGMTQAGLWPDDSSHYIPQFTFMAAPPTSRAGVWGFNITWKGVSDD